MNTIKTGIRIAVSPGGQTADCPAGIFRAIQQLETEAIIACDPMPIRPTNPARFSIQGLPFPRH
jgi:hypothetical protein